MAEAEYSRSRSATSLFPQKSEWETGSNHVSAYGNNFGFTDLAAGTYELVVEADGYQAYRATCQVVPGVTPPRQEIVLEPGATR